MNLSTICKNEPLNAAKVKSEVKDIGSPYTILLERACQKRIDSCFFSYLLELQL